MGCRSSKIVDEARDGATPRSVPIVSVDGEILVCTPVPDELDDFSEFGEHNVYACLKYLRDVALDKHEMGSATVDTPCECCVCLCRVRGVPGCPVHVSRAPRPATAVRLPYRAAGDCLGTHRARVALVWRPHSLRALYTRPAARVCAVSALTPAASANCPLPHPLAPQPTASWKGMA